MSESTDSKSIDYQNPQHIPHPIKPPNVIGWIVAGILVIALLIVIMLPSLGRARETANRVKCASNLRQIAQAIALYAGENRGARAPDFTTLLLTQDLVPEVFICPSCDLQKATGLTPAEIEQSMLTGEHLSYAFVAGDAMVNSDPDTILAFDLEPHLPKDGAKGTGINVLVGDGSVTFVDDVTAMAIRARYVAGVRPIRLSDCKPMNNATTKP